MIYNPIYSCEVCGNEYINKVLDLGLHPMCDDLVPINENRDCLEYPIEIGYCKECFTAHQLFQIPKEDLFPNAYHYRARFTQDVLDGMSDLVEACEDKFVKPLYGKFVLDVGCNDGSLLNFFKAKGARTLGVEPTGAYLDAERNGHPVINDYFNIDLAGSIVSNYGKPDVITFTNVFAHIEDLPSLLKALKVLIGPETLLLIENHYLGSVLKNLQFDTFYHEHPRTYSLRSFELISENLGLGITDFAFPSRYGGNVRVFIGDSNKQIPSVVTRINDVIKNEKRFGDQLFAMQSSVTAWKEKMMLKLNELVAQHGPLRAKAFPGRSAILIKLLELNENMIEAVYEQPGSMKLEHFVPGTRIPIRSDDELFRNPNKTPVILNLAWHISSEIHSYLESRGFNGVIVDIYDPTDIK